MEITEIEGVAERLPLVGALERLHTNLELNHENQIIRKQHSIGPFPSSRNVILQKQVPTPGNRRQFHQLIDATSENGKLCFPGTGLPKILRGKAAFSGS